MMGEKEVSISSGVVSKERVDSVSPMYFSSSFAFVALQLLSTAEGPVINSGGWSAITNRILIGSAQLIGLLVWKAHGGEAMKGMVELLNKLKKAESAVAELKRIRTEDAKANEKVVSIFATQEQSWISERKRLKQQIHALLNNLRSLETKEEGILSNLNKRIEEKEHLMQAKDEALEEETSKRIELEERLRMAESVSEEMREMAKREAQDHSSELWKHKTAFIELVSNQRQLESEMGRAIRQMEATKQELVAILEQKEESVAIIQKLSLEIMKMKKDAEQKDKILSAMLRKSKLDTAEKETLLKEVKLSKARRKQAELETERWRTRYELRPNNHLRSNLGSKADSRSEKFIESKRLASVEAGCSYRWNELQHTKNGVNTKPLLLNYLESEHRKELEWLSKKMSNGTDDNFGQYSPEEKGELTITTNAKQLEDWVRLETEKYISILEQRHHEEIDAFSEQMRLKDEKLESFRRQLLSMELELKRLQSHIEGLDENISHFKEEKMKLEALLLDRDYELKSLKEKFSMLSLHCRKSNSSYNAMPPEIFPDAIWSEVEIIKQKQGEKDQEQEVGLVGISLEIENDTKDRRDKKALVESKSSEIVSEKEQTSKERIDINISNSYTDDALVGIYEQSEERERREKPFENQLHDTRLVVRARGEDILEEKEVGFNLGYANNCQESEAVDKLPPVGKCLVKKDSPFKMDLHALGVSYKIKRLKQQLLLVENLAATQTVKNTASKSNATATLDSYQKRKIDENGQLKNDFLLLMSLLNKQVKRYLTLEEKTDDLSKRMREKDQEVYSRGSSTVRTNEQTGMLEHFLDEAFQVQRYMVATGQKLIEIQSKIACSFVVTAEGLDKSSSIDLKQFEDRVRTLFREIQRGLEVRIARIIGDIEGTLACEVIMKSRYSVQ